MAMVWRTCPACQQKARVPNNRQVFCPQCGADMSGALNAGETISAVGSLIMWGGCLIVFVIIFAVGIWACATS